MFLLENVWNMSMGPVDWSGEPVHGSMVDSCDGVAKGLVGIKVCGG